MPAGEDAHGFFGELKRRNVFRVAIAYLAGSWLLVEVSETLFPIYGLSDAAVRLVVTLLAIGFPLTLIFSWVFELTPEGLKLEKDIDPSVSVSHHTGKKLDRIIIVLLAFALGYFAFDKFVLEPNRVADIVQETAQQARSDALVESYGDKSIAVLPFVNLSADPEQEYFSDGISEELLNLLAKIPELRVISRSSAFTFKGKDIAIPKVAAQLNVAHVLEGSVRKAGKRVRITAQLIEARSDSHLWSESYDRELDDIFAVQEEIAAAIGDALEVRLALVAGDAVQPTAIKTTSSGAFDAYLRGRELIYRRGLANLQEAVRQLERSLRLDDNFASAHAQLAIANALLPGYDDSTLPIKARRTAVFQLDRAQALEPDLAEAHGGRALLALDDDPESAIAHARKALTSNPSYVDAMIWLRLALRQLGRYGEADASLRQILLADPLSIIGRYSYARLLSGTGKIAEAHEVADQLLEQSKRMGNWAHADTSLINEGKIAESLSWALRGQVEIHVMAAFIRVGEYDEARRINDDTQNFFVDLAEGRFDEAIPAAQEKMLLDPDDVRAPRGDS